MRKPHRIGQRKVVYFQYLFVVITVCVANYFYPSEQDKSRPIVVDALGVIKRCDTCNLRK